MPKARQPQYEYINRYGWLHDDGVLDLQAVYIAAYERRPNLTYREALLTVFLLKKAGFRNHEIAIRLDVGKRRVGEMIEKINKGNRQEYVDMLSNPETSIKL